MKARGHLPRYYRTKIRGETTTRAVKRCRGIAKNENQGKAIFLFRGSLVTSGAKLRMTFWEEDRLKGSGW